MKVKFLGLKLNDIQYKTEKTIKRRPIATMDEGALEAKFSELDKNGIIISRAKEYILRALNFDSWELEDEENPDHGQGYKEFAIFDCVDLNGVFNISGIRDGNIHLVCNDELGTSHNIIIPGVFKNSGQPKVKGIAIVKSLRDTKQNLSFKLLGYVDFQEYIGVSAKSLVALEDIIKDNIRAIKSGANKIPEYVLKAKIDTIN